MKVKTKSDDPHTFTLDVNLQKLALDATNLENTMHRKNQEILAGIVRKLKL